MKEGYIKVKSFEEIDLSDTFFDSLKEDYPAFNKWFHAKKDKQAYVIYNTESKLEGFLHVKIEHNRVDDIVPPIVAPLILKIGTFKVNPHGTKLGERFIKKSLDIAIANHVDICYVTVFEKHSYLINLLKKYGFYEHGQKEQGDKIELVLAKDMKKITNDVLNDYPLLNYKNKNIYLLAIYPKYHSKMFPDSILNNESFDILEDQSHTNSIHKVYLSAIPSVCNLRRGDIIVIYRTKDDKGSAEYHSVVTSICTVEVVKNKGYFPTYEKFYENVNSYSIFDENDLKLWYNKENFYAIKMLYNVALSKRVIRKALIEQIGVSRSERPSFIKLTEAQLIKLLEKGAVNESYVVN